MDTALALTLIALAAAEELKRLLLERNHCEVKVVEERLVARIQSSGDEATRLLFTLSLLYLFEGKQQFKRAVEVALFQLQRLRSRSPERRQLLEIFTHVLYGLDGSDEALVFKCSARIYAEAPELVLRCFVDERGLIGHLNIYHVTSHLLALAKEQPSVLERNRLAIEYLKTVAPHVAGSALSASAEYNIPQRLAALYIETIAALEKEAEGEVTQETTQAIQETTQAIQETTQAIQETTQAIQETTQEELQATTQMTQTTQPTTQPTTQQESQAESQAATLRRELQELLRSNEQVLPEQLLAMLPAAGMQRERCMLLAKLHRHEEALRLLLGEPPQLEMAYDYCDEVAASGRAEDADVYLTLLKVLLEKREEEGVAQEIARFIDRYHEHLDAERVLELFPDDVSFDQLYPYTAQAITALTESMYNTRMKYNLLMSEFMENKHAIALSRQNGVEVGENSVCAKCQKPLGTSAIVWVSDSQLYHYSCCEMEGNTLLMRDKRSGVVDRIPVTESKV